jgi:Bacterial Ig-like domain (group 3)/FG-GAP-like repeat
MPFRFSPFCYVCLSAVLLTALVAGQSDPVAQAKPPNAFLDAQKPRGGVQLQTDARNVLGQTAGAGQTGVGTSDRLPASRFQTNRLGISPTDSAAFLFLPAVTYPAGPQADSVAVADVNGDGKPDLVVANGCLTPSNCGYSEGEISVLLGNGDGTFQTAVTYPTYGLGSYSLVVADLNGDGHPDVVVANNWSNSVSVLMGNGDGTFRTPVVYSSGGLYPDSIAIGDVNGDGKPDLVVANFDQNSNDANGGVSVLLGNGDGTFQAPTSFSSGEYDATSIAIADVNGDGHLDLIVVNLCQSVSTCGEPSGVSVLLGKGDGSFKEPVSYSSGVSPSYSVAVGDLNRDGHPDLVVAGNTEGMASVLLGNGDGTFQAAIGYSSGVYGIPYGIVIRDVNNDGYLDLVMTYGSDCGPCGGAVSFLLGNGDGTFQTAVSYSSGAFKSGGGGNLMAVADVNGDGTPDLVVANQCGNEWFSCDIGTVSVLLNNNGAPLTTTSLVSSLNPVNLNQMVTYTATVTSQAGGTVNGAVTFWDSFSTVPTVVTLVNNRASYSTSYPSYPKGEIGAHLITATYPGSLHNALGSQSTLTEYVRGALSKTVVTTSGSPSFVGQPVTFTATVTSTSGAIPDGELVTFYNGSKLLASVPLAGGKAAYTTSLLAAFKHLIKAAYLGDTKFEPSSGTVVQVVERYPTTTTLSSSPNPSIFGQAVILTATVSSTAPGGPTGTVTFKNGTTTLGGAKLISGKATLTTKSLPVGTLTITAIYNGDTYSAKSSGTTTQTVQ